MTSMFGFEGTRAVHIDGVGWTDGGARRVSPRLVRLIAGLVVAFVGMYGALHSFDPVSLSVGQVFFLLTTVAGVALASLGQE
jgi:hypothetical protein